MSKTKKELILEIINDAIKRKRDYIVLQMQVDNSNIDIRNRYFGYEYMQQCTDIINKKYNDELVNKDNHHIKITSAVGANRNNTMEEIDDAIFSNYVYLL